jgi:hypothetical protein
MQIETTELSELDKDYHRWDLTEVYSEFPVAFVVTKEAIHSCMNRFYNTFRERSEIFWVKI